MHVLRIEHSVPDFEQWKKVFDSDPADRKASGVLGYEILRSVENSNHIMINLQFGTVDQARAFLTSVQRVWEDVGADSIQEPQASIGEHVEYKQL
jgi:quinol monooxygenase YgiN